MTYPDSVRRVNPPKITSPNTLAALPNNQYATPLELTSGKLDFDLELLVLSEFTVASVLSDFREEGGFNLAIASLLAALRYESVVNNRELSCVLQPRDDERARANLGAGEAGAQCRKLRPVFWASNARAT